MHNYLKVKNCITLTLATSALRKFHMIEAPRGGRACYQSNSFMTEVCITHHPYPVSYGDLHPLMKVTITESTREVLFFNILTGRYKCAWLHLRSCPNVARGDFEGRHLCHRPVQREEWSGAPLQPPSGAPPHYTIPILSPMHFIPSLYVFHIFY